MTPMTPLNAGQHMTEAIALLVKARQAYYLSQWEDCQALIKDAWAVIDAGNKALNQQIGGHSET